MKKGVDERLNEVLDDIPSPGYAATLFTGWNANALRDIIIDDLNDHWTAAESIQLSELLSLGGVRIIKRSDETATRALKRLLMLFHRVPGYHTHFETLSLKQTILAQGSADVLPKAQFEIKRAVKFMTDQKYWANELAVRHGGRLVHYYDQGEDARLNEFDKTENGWCLGMSVHWLACRAQKLEFWGTHLSETGAAKYRFVMAAQGVRSAVGATGDRASFRLKKYGLTHEATTTKEGDERGVEMAAAITRTGFPFARIGQYYKGGGGHAMAACLEGVGVRFLDPNCGEFLFASIDGFYSWYPLFLRKLGYVFTKYYVEGYRLETRSAAPTTELRDVLAGRRAAMGYDD